MEIANQFSFVFIALLIHIGSIVAAAVWFPGTAGLLLVLFVLVGLLALAAVMGSQDSDDFSRTPPDALIGKGTPVLLTVYSNF